MGIHTFFLVATTFLNKIDVWYDQAAKWCFTRHLDEIFSLGNIDNIISGRINLFSDGIFTAWTATSARATFLYNCVIIIFEATNIALTLRGLMPMFI